jgi:hypothetical protein
MILKTRQALVRGLIVAAIVNSGLPGTAFAQATTPAAHVHLRHVAVQFRGTPDGAGLLPTAIAEAEIALQHATLAARDPGDLDGIRRHAGHVLHALAPDRAERGPGLGYGVTLAAERTAHYVELAMAADGGGEALSTHGPHVVTATRHALLTTERAVELAAALLEEEDVGAASARLEELVASCHAIVNGVDANGDGRVGWQEGEGGLAQAAQHLELLRRGEGLIG